MTIRRPKYPSLYQVNTRVWLNERAARLGRPTTLDDFDDAFLDEVAGRGFDWLWPLGVWQTGPAARAISRANEGLLAELARDLPDFTIDDVCGSPFAIREYRVHEDFGGDAALARLRERLHARGLRLLCDFVPNHTAPDHPWAYERPEFYIAGSEADLRREPQNYAVVETTDGPRILARGRDPYFDAWRDVLQLNYRSHGLRDAMIAELQRIATQCDGVRCDMAMLLSPDVIEQTWGSRATPADGSAPVLESFWREAIPQVHSVSPDFTFVAEVYWNREWELQQEGFHYCYDKRLYDRLHEQNAPEVRAHLAAGLDYQEKLARFLENHDEPRAASVFPRDVHAAAAVLTFFAPGLRFVHEGQLEGRTTRVSMHVGRRPNEPVDRDVAAFYAKLLATLTAPVTRDGVWRLATVSPAWNGNDSHAGFVAYAWDGPEGARRLVVVNYAGGRGQCRIAWPWPGDARQRVALCDRFHQVAYHRDGDELNRDGMYFDEPAWAYYVFDVERA